MTCSLPPLSFWFELGAAITATIFWRSLNNTPLRWFIPFLWLIVLVEGSAHYMWCSLRQPNAWLFNFSVPVEYIFYAIIFRMVCKNEVFKKIAGVFIILMAAYSIYSIVFITSLKFFNMKILSIGSFSMVLLSILYFIDLYNNNFEESLFKNPFFWVFMGVILFNIGEFSYNLLASFISLDVVTKTLKTFREINRALSLVLYSCFIIAFICQKISGTYRKV